MKPYFLLYKWIVCLLVMFALLPFRAFAETNYSDLYISISDAIMETKKGNEAEAFAALEQFKISWNEQSTDKIEQVNEIDKALENAENASFETRGTALSELSKALHALEKAENPVDETAQRQEFENAMLPALTAMQKAIDEGSLEEIETANRQFIADWTRNERPVREQNIAAYGAIETKMAFMRITLAEETPDLTLLQTQFDELKDVIHQFAEGTIEEKRTDVYSLATLVGLLDDSVTSLKKDNREEAQSALREFIQVWPNVEGEVRTKNAKLYTKVENDIPLIAGKLANIDFDTGAAQEKLKSYQQQIALLQENNSFSFWDSALILLREGLEALLIIMALFSFLTSAGQQSMRKWVILGAAAGIGFSIAAAVLMSTIFQSATIGNSREMMEGYIGLAAAAFMIGVGVWMHQKSSVASWNRYISRQMGQAISKGSVFAMASVSFLSVFREGAETIVFYAGIAPKMTTAEFVSGILLAVGILAVVTWIFFKVSYKLPLHRFFAVATVLIYFLAFKIIGVSVHTLQLTNNISTSIVPKLPVLDAMGFYPTTETIAGQAILLISIAVAAIIKKMQDNNSPRTLSH